MSKRLLFALSLLVVLSVAALFRAPLTAQAQSRPTPPPPLHPGVHPIPVVGGNGIVKGPDGLWYGAARAARNPNVVPAATGGPDNFGYTWDDSVAFSWIDATDGTDTGMSGDSWGQGVGPISLPFPFKFYEHTYNELYIAASGYISFTEQNGDVYFFALPSPAPPNNIIAPYAVPLSLSNTGPTGRVYYKSGGTAPNRYFVVEWYQVSDWDDGNYTFEVVLYENGDIVFQYETMTYGDSGPCGAAGIEDDTGYDGLAYLESCQHVASNTAVRFIRPAPAARVKVLQPYHGAFFTPNETKSFQVSVRNTGEMGADTYDITITSDWPVTMYDEAAGANLTDTDGDGTVDTGPMDEGETKVITVITTAPASASVGNANTAHLTFTSSLDASKTATAMVQGTIPAPFVQTFSGETGVHEDMYLIQPNTQTLKQVAPGEGLHIYYPAVAQTPTGFINVWEEVRREGNIYLGELRYALLDHSGNVAKVDKLTDYSGSTTSTFDSAPRVAVLSNGIAGIVWSHHVENGAEQIYFDTIDTKTGNLIAGPVNVSNVSEGYAYFPAIAATDDGRFVIAWEYWNSSTGEWKEYYAVLNAQGNVIHTPALLPSESYTPVLAPLNGAKVLVAYGIDWTVHTLILDSNGNIVQPDTALSGTDNVRWLNDALLLPNGQVAVAWIGWNGDESLVQVAILNDDGTLAAGPVPLSHPAAGTQNTGPSLSADLAGHLIVTWVGQWDYRPYLFYALLDSAGNVVVPPTIALEKGSDNFVVSYLGQGNTTYLTFGDVPYTSWAASWIEKLYNAGLTHGYPDGTYRPENPVSRAEMAVFLLRAEHGADYQPSSYDTYSFSDIAGHWAANWIEELHQEGYTNGYPDGTYRPNASATRAEMAVFLLRVKHGLDYQPPNYDTYSFSDIAGHWAANWIEALHQEGYTNGYPDGTYRPDNGVTRAEMAVFLCKVFDLP